jgi:Fe-S cluster biogenesis protein NfuA
MSVLIEQTPNPNALKFLVSREVVGSKMPKFYKKDSVDSLTEDVPLAHSLFQFNGVTDVFFGSNFITVGKNDTVDWGEIRSEIMEVIRDYDNSNHPYVIDDFPKPACENLNSDVTHSKIEKNIIHLIDTRVRPAVAMDGGDIIFHSFENGTVYLEMYGACSGCPSSTATLKMGIENMLRHYIPEVHTVEAV